MATRAEEVDQAQHPRVLVRDLEAQLRVVDLMSRNPGRVVLWRR
jgi:hypothetical protein